MVVGFVCAEGEGSFEWEGPKTGGSGGYGRAKAEESHMDPQTRTAYFRQQVSTREGGEGDEEGTASTDQAWCLVGGQISSLGMGLLPEADLARVWSRVARRLYSTESQQVGI